MTQYNLIYIVCIILLIGVASVYTDLRAEEAKGKDLGPCQIRGCDGLPFECDSYALLQIGSIKVTRTCKGTPLKTTPEPGNSELEVSAN